MHTLEATGDIRKVSFWLAHASIQSTEAYLRVDPVEKLEILAARLPPGIVKGSFSGATDRLSPSWRTREARSYVKRTA